MNRWMRRNRRIGFGLVVCGSTLFLAGCGTRELGPANPDETPKVDESEIQQNIERSMPEKYRKQYQKQS